MGTTERFVLTWALGLVVAGAACVPASPSGDNLSSTEPSGGNATTGSIGLQLQVAPGVTLSTIDWTIHNTALLASDLQGSVDLSHSQAGRFIVGGLPAGTAYVITLAGTTDGPGPLDCAGSASFDVTANAQTAAAVAVVCSGAQPTDAGSAGSVQINVNTSVLPACPGVTGITALPSSVDIGGQIELDATGAETDNVSWAATGGAGSVALIATNPPTTTFITCLLGGPVNITVTAALSDGGACVPTPSSSASITITCTIPALSCDGGVAPVPERVEYYSLLTVCFSRPALDLACQDSLLPKNPAEVSSIGSLCLDNLTRLEIACR